MAYVAGEEARVHLHGRCVSWLLQPPIFVDDPVFTHGVGVFLRARCPGHFHGTEEDRGARFDADALTNG